MIRVSKQKKDTPASFLAKAVTETTFNKIAIKKGKFKTLIFKVYKDKELAIALNGIFKNKCAYCESRASHAAPWDVEHFRPKSKTFKKGQKRVGYIGYYWLAGDWDNLLISCQYCNRPNKHYIPGLKDMITIGKHEQFPLDDDSKRWLIAGSKKQFVKEESVRLLVHPCKDFPETFFEFIIIGNDAGGIKAKSTLSGIRLRKAEQSITTYALHRMGLKNKRAETINNIEFLILIINREIISYKAASLVNKLGVRKRVEEYLQRLVKTTDEDQEFSALAKQIVIPYLQRIRPHFKVAL